MYNQGDFICLTKVIIHHLPCFFFSATFREPHFGESEPIQLRQCQSTLCIFHGTLRPQKPAPPMDQQKKHQEIGQQKPWDPRNHIHPNHWFLVIIIRKLYIHDQYAKVTQKSHRNFLASSESHQWFNPWKAFHWDTPSLSVASEGW